MEWLGATEHIAGWILAALAVGLLLGIAVALGDIRDEVREIRQRLEDEDDDGGDDDGEAVPWRRAS